METIIPEAARFGIVKKLILERLIYTPLFQAFALYTLARLEGKNHNGALNQLLILYIPMLLAGWKYLTVVQIVNFTVVPPMVSICFVTTIR